MVAASRRLLVVLPVALAALLASCGSDAPTVAALTRGEVAGQLAKPAPGMTREAKRLETQAGSVMAGSGKQAEEQLTAELRALKGTPVVVNLWGEWCGPCKKEMPLLQRAALKERGKVVFLGVATLSDRSKSAAYLKTQIALPYPSLLDNPGDLNKGTGIDSVPKTFFYTAAGKRTVHQGAYETQADFEADLQRYALAG